MDMLSIKTKFMRKIISEVITKMILKKLGKEIIVDLQDVEFGHRDGSDMMSLNCKVNVSMSTKTLEELIKGAI